MTTRARILPILLAFVLAGARLIATPFAMSNFDVSDDASLRAAIANAADGDTITFTANITLVADLPVVQANVTILGQGRTLSGNNQFRGFFVGRWAAGTATQQAVTVVIQDLTIQNAAARGGAGRSQSRAGGGGAGLGGAIFVANLANVTASNLNLTTNRAIAGNGGTGTFTGGSGAGGGLGGNGGNANFVFAGGGGGGGGFGIGADGGNGNNNGLPGIASGAAGGGTGGGTTGMAGGTSGGGGGGGGGAFTDGGAGGGIGGAGGTDFVGGNGGFGGGGGGAASAFGAGGNGGFGGGGGGSTNTGGNGGFGGGGGGASQGTRGLGGFGGGNGSLAPGGGQGGGGGAGLGGAIFVQQGGSLTLTGPLTLNGNTVTAGNAGGGLSTGGSAFGSGIFVHGNDAGNGGTGSLTFSPGSGETQTVANAIADQTGSGGSGGNAGAWGLAKAGAGTLVLGGANTFTGATTVGAGTLLVNGSTAAGTTMTVANGATLSGTGTINGSVVLQAGAFLGSSVTISGSVTGTASTSTAILPSSVSVPPGTSQTFTATVTSGSATVSSGTVTFTDTTTATTLASNVALSASGQASISAVLGVGSHTIRATYNPDVRHTGSSGTTSVTTLTADQTIAFAALGARTFGDAPFTISATASSGLAVTFTALTPSVCTMSGSTVTIIAAGICTIAADQGGDSSLEPAPRVTQTFTAAKANQSVTFAALPERTLGEAPFALSATASSQLTVTLSSVTPAVCTVTGATVTLVAAGTCTIAADQLGNANFTAAPQVTRSFVVGSACSAVAPVQLPAGLIGLPYTQALTLGNAVAPVGWSLTGTLPAGLTFDNGVLSGTPTTRGAYSVSVTGTDAGGCQASASYTLAISPERRLLVGAGPGASTVRAFNLGSTTSRVDLDAFGGFSGGVSVAQGDTDGNGVPDAIVGAGAGAGPAIAVFDDGRTTARLSFLAFDASFRGGVDVAAGDITGDGIPEILAAAQGCSAAPLVRAFDGRSGALVREYTIAPPASSCGLHVAAGDVNGDGVAEIIVGSGGDGAPFAQIVDGSTGATLRQITPYATGFLGGVYVAAGDVTGDGFADVVTGAGYGGSPQVRVFDGPSGAQIAGPLGSFLAYPAGFPGGVRVGAGDLNGDGRADVITGAGFGGGPHVRVFDGATATEIFGLFAFAPTAFGGTFVAGPAPAARMALDIPATGATVSGGSVRIAGWALRDAAADSPGTDLVHAWAVPAGGGAPRFVGASTGRTARPDVAAYFGGEFLMSGFDFTGTLAPGTYDLIVFARNSRTGRFDQARVVRITVP